MDRSYRRCQSKTIAAALHIAGIASFINSFGNVQAHQFLNSRGEYVYPGWSAFLTLLTLGASLATFVVALIYDIFRIPGFNKVHSILSVISTPMESLVAFLYWGLVFIDAKLVRPEQFQIALSVDIGFHLAPAIFTLVDAVLFSAPWIPSTRTMFVLYGALALGYWLYLDSIYKVVGIFPYPILQRLSNTQRLGLFSFATVMAFTSYLAIKLIYAIVNPSAFPRGVKLTK